MGFAPSYSEFLQLGHSASEAEFGALLPSAVAVVDRIVGPNEVTEETAIAYKAAVCSCLSKLGEYGDGPLQSIHLGSFSATAAAGESGRNVAVSAAMDCLVPAGLAFTGV